MFAVAYEISAPEISIFFDNWRNLSKTCIYMNECIMNISILNDIVLLNISFS